ncbi:MAG: UDP-2,3-diacylglucosamine diphosphatase [Comamonas sp.]|nr:UDP-2,3-diacylglucosamine diphosphatase [Comamonas sp.]
MQAQPPAQTLLAPAHWQRIDVVADLHLQACQAATLAAWQRFLAYSPADAIFILGDLFEAWVGDDALLESTSFEAQCTAQLYAASQQRPIYFMVGNRDFLAGADFLRASGMHGLADPTLLIWQERRILLSHGDALCLDDVEYQQFRTISRNPAWQQQLLAQPLAQRRALASHIRSESEQRKQSGAQYADADPSLTTQWLDAAQAQWLIHGHTHRPAEHLLADGRYRIVLSDWALDNAPATQQQQQQRCEVLRLHPHPHEWWQRLSLAQALCHSRQQHHQRHR